MRKIIAGALAVIFSALLWSGMAFSAPAAPEKPATPAMEKVNPEAKAPVKAVKKSHKKNHKAGKKHHKAAKKHRKGGKKHRKAAKK